MNLLTGSFVGSLVVLGLRDMRSHRTRAGGLLVFFLAAGAAAFVVLAGLEPQPLLFAAAALIGGALQVASRALPQLATCDGSLLAGSAVAAVATLSAAFVATAAPPPPAVELPTLTPPTTPIVRPSPRTVAPSPTSPPPTRILISMAKTGTGTGDVLIGEDILCESRCTQAQAIVAPGRVELHAAPGFGSEFKGWTVATCADKLTCALTVSSDVQIGARFEPRVAGAGLSARNCDSPKLRQVRRGEQVQLAACFQNTGTVAWTVGTPAQVDLAFCCPLHDSELARWVERPLSANAFSTSTSTVVTPGATARFVFSLRVPADASLGAVDLHGALAMHATGAPVTGGSYVQQLEIIAATPIASPTKIP